MAEEIRKLKICYLSDLPVRIKNSRRILWMHLARRVEYTYENGFSTDDAEYLFVDCSNVQNVAEISADQVIIDWREPMITIAKDILKESCVPIDYQKIDDREIGTSDYEPYRR